MQAHSDILSVAAVILHISHSTAFDAILHIKLNRIIILF